MKIVFGLAVLIVFGLVVLWLMGGFSSESPEEQSRKFKAVAIKGAAWEDVVKASAPRKYRIYGVNNVMRNGEMVEEHATSVENDFDLDDFKVKFAKGEFAHGFMFPYRFAENDSFNVIFDGNGKVSDIEKNRTMSDLLNMPQTR